MRCPGCDVETAEGTRFCEDCGAALPLACPSCGAEATPGKRFCRVCGAGLSADVREPEDSAGDGEHKPVTVLFCDIVGSTGIAERIGAEAMHELLSRFSDLANDEVSRYGGTISTFMGDGFMALFGVPVAHEDHARRAALAALSLRRRLADELAAAASQPLEVRIGINSGQVVVGSLAGGPDAEVTAIGDTINVAARLERLAEPGTILMSGATARVVSGYVRSEPVGEVEVRGRRAAVTTHRLLGHGSRRSPLEGTGSRPLGRFVGRERQLATLRDLVAEAASGQGQIVGVVADPGMGKSRIVTELRRVLADERLTVLEGRCLSYGASIPYVPIVDILRANFGITDADQPSQVEAKVSLGLAELGIDAAERVSVVLNLLGQRSAVVALAGLTPEAIKKRTFDTLLTMVRTGSRRRPILLLVEDIHWIDGVSEEFLTLLAESLPGNPVALLVTYRPGYHAPWGQHSYATQLALPRLTPSESLAVVRSVVRDLEVPNPVVQEVVDRAEGNPFFLEELARTVAESGPERDSSVPDTVQDVLMARLDRLPDEARRVLQTASVLGREFPLRLLEAIWSGPGRVEPHLAELKRLEFVHDVGGADSPVYVFNHALTQDVAYESLLESRRRGLHEAAGRAYEAIFTGRLEEVYDRLAHHYGRTDRADKAVEYLGLLADSAVRTYAHSEAAASLRAALAHADRLPVDIRGRQVCELTMRLTYSLYFLGSFRESLEVLQAAEPRLPALGDPGLAGRIHFWLGHTYTHAGDHRGAARSVEKAIEEATSASDVATFGKAQYVLARESFWLGRFREGAEHGRAAAASLQRTDEWWFLGHAHAWTGLNVVHTGAFETAIAEASRMKEIGRVREDPRLQSYAAWNIAWYEATRGNWARAIAEGTESLERSPDPLNSAYSMGWLGFAYREKGDHAQAIVLLERAIALLTEFGYSRLVAWFTGWLAEALLWEGDRQRALATAQEAVRLSRGVGFPWAVAVALRSLGRVRADMGDAEAADGHLAEALADFEEMGCAFEVAVTRLALAELALDRGDPEKARAQVEMARAGLAELDAPRYTERAEQMAASLPAPG